MDISDKKAQRERSAGLFFKHWRWGVGGRFLNLFQIVYYRFVAPPLTISSGSPQVNTIALRLICAAPYTVDNDQTILIVVYLYH